MMSSMKTNAAACSLLVGSKENPSEFQLERAVFDVWCEVGTFFTHTHTHTVLLTFCFSLLQTHLFIFSHFASHFRKNPTNTQERMGLLL
jgi:hypothetical protein